MTEHQGPRYQYQILVDGCPMQHGPFDPTSAHHPRDAARTYRVINPTSAVWIEYRDNHGDDNRWTAREPGAPDHNNLWCVVSYDPRTGLFALFQTPYEEIVTEQEEVQHADGCFTAVHLAADVIRDGGPVNVWDDEDDDHVHTGGGDNCTTCGAPL